MLLQELGLALVGTLHLRRGTLVHFPLGVPPKLRRPQVDSGLLVRASEGVQIIMNSLSFSQCAHFISLRFGLSQLAAGSGGFGFGNTNTAPAPGGSGFGFGGTPGPAPSTSLFGGSSAPAPSGGFGGFSQPAGVPAAPGTSSTGAMLALHGKTPYNQLPPDMKKAIDTIHEAMMKHKRSTIQVQGMGPQSLIITNEKEALPPRLKKLHLELNVVQQKLSTLQSVTTKYREAEEQIVLQAYQYAKWPTEAMAARRGVRLHAQEEKKDPDMQTQLREMLEQQLQYVDRIERMPSPYLWQTLDHMHQTLNSLTDDVTNLRQELERTNVLDEDVVNVTNVIDTQDQIIYVLRRDLHKLHYDMSKLRKTYTAVETGENVLDRAQMEEWERQKSIDEQLQIRLLRSSKDPVQSANQAPAAPGGAPATSTTGFSFGGSAAQAPTGTSTAPSSFSLGGSSAPAPVAGAPTQSSSTGFSFGGAAPNAAPAQSAFGATPAPAFGASATTTGGFGIAKPSTSTATSTPSKKKSGSRGRQRR